jgi:signal transduction histidine kinase
LAGDSGLQAETDMISVPVTEELMKTILAAVIVLLATAGTFCTAGTPIPGEVSCDKGVNMDRVQALVNRTADALRKNQNQVIDEINRGDSKWKDGVLYVAVFDGTKVVAHGYFPSVVGQDVGSSQYLNSFPFVSSGRRIALEKGGGCMEYRFHNPAKHGQVEEKIGYSTKVSGTVWVASGTYLVK